MRKETKEYEVFTFDELEDDIKEKVINDHYDWNVSDSYWYEHIYEDAKTIGLEIQGFDFDRGHTLDGKFTEYEERMAELILENHGDVCETYKLAKKFLDEFIPLVEEKEFEEEKDDYDFDKCEEMQEKIDGLEEDFRNDIKSEYLSILQKEYEYLISEEQIIESIKANEIEFLANGEIYR